MVLGLFHAPPAGAAEPRPVLILVHARIDWKVVSQHLGVLEPCTYLMIACEERLFVKAKQTIENTREAESLSDSIYIKLLQD